MPKASGPSIVQVGLGNFGQRHLNAWKRLEMLGRLWIAERDERRRGEAQAAGIPADRIVSDAAQVLDRVDIVDIVTPSEQHMGPARAALAAGKDVFIEKPMTMTSADARELAETVERTGRILQVGYYYRFHPASQQLKALLDAGRLGGIRYITGDFRGFKRARNDVGVTHTDGIHFLDLFNWLLGAFPQDVYAVCRDHFGRGLEDFSVVLLTYPGGTVGKVESGYIQPGRWPDKVVAGAKTTKELTVVGDRATVEIDFEAETCTLTEARHESVNGVWAPQLGAPQTLPVESCDPVALVARELQAFLDAVKTRQPAQAGPIASGVRLAELMEGLYESARRGQPVRLPGQGERDAEPASVKAR